MHPFNKKVFVSGLFQYIAVYTENGPKMLLKTCKSINLHFIRHAEELLVVAAMQDRVLLVDLNKVEERAVIIEKHRIVQSHILESADLLLLSTA